ncbi:MAG: hypothetical protein Fur0021_04760 [Candidatus Promineifilaceae bacterium]
MVINSPTGARVGSATDSSLLPAFVALPSSTVVSIGSGAGPQAAASNPTNNSRSQSNLDKARILVKANSFSQYNLKTCGALQRARLI